MPLLVIDDLGMRKLAHTAAEDLLELIMRRDQRASALLTSNRPVDDWGKLLGDTAAVTALLIDCCSKHGPEYASVPSGWCSTTGALRSHEMDGPSPVPVCLSSNWVRAR